MAQKYRKRPVIIEAMQFLHLDAECTSHRIIEWMKSSGGKSTVQDGRLLIDTLEGTMEAAPNDWVVRGVKGEFYPCKPDIFDATYEAVV